MAEYKQTFGNICLLGCAILSNLIQLCQPEEVVGEAPEAEDGDYLMGFYGLPGFQHDFKIEVGAGGMECFYQRLQTSCKLHVSFEVLRGADRNVDMRIVDANELIIGNFQWTNEGNFEYNITVPGVYSFCVDNSLSRFSSKLVYLYLLSYNEQEWMKFVSNVNQYSNDLDNVSHSLEKFHEQISKVLVYQASARRHLAADWYMVKSNNYNVQRLSIAMSVIIVAASAFQVFFVRRLFNVSPKAKPRA